MFIFYRIYLHFRKLNRIINNSIKQLTGRSENCFSQRKMKFIWTFSAHAETIKPKISTDEMSMILKSQTGMSNNFMRIPYGL